jgi:FtsH-binding integral membrane protein
MSVSGSSPFLPDHARVTREGTVYDPTAPPRTPDLDAQAIEDSQRALLVRVYALMFFGLMVSAAVAFWAASHSEISAYTLRHPEGFQIIFFSELVAVAFISRYVAKLTIPMAWVLFFFYAVFNGVSFSVFFLYFPPAAVTFGFLFTAITFGFMALYGHTHHVDLGAGRSILAMGTYGFALQLFCNLALGHSEAYFGTATLGLIVFCGLASYHAQNIRNFEWEFEDDDAKQDKAALIGALLLYLDFVNLYMYIMRAAATVTNRNSDED